MFSVKKDPALDTKEIQVGFTEVQYPAPEQWHTKDFYTLVDVELSLLRAKYADYERQETFAKHPCFRFFQKLKKIYPVTLRLEAFLVKGKPFPRQNPAAEISSLTEMYSLILSCAHDAGAIQGDLELVLANSKESFSGTQGEMVSTRPGDLCGRDDGGLIFSTTAGANARTCVKASTTHVLYPVFGAPGLPKEELRAAQVLLEGCAKVLAPDAQVESMIL